MRLHSYHITAQTRFRVDPLQVNSKLSLSLDILRYIADEKPSSIFLDTFGSHFYKGDHDLGGYYCLWVSAASNKTTTLQALQTAVNHEFSGVIAGNKPEAFSGNATGAYAQSKGNGTASSSGSAMLEVIKGYEFSGTDVKSFERFSEAIKASNARWVIVGRPHSSPSRFVPIWEILTAHGFEDLASRLRITWLQRFWTEFEPRWTCLAPTEREFFAGLLANEGAEGLSIIAKLEEIDHHGLEKYSDSAREKTSKEVQPALERYPRHFTFVPPNVLDLTTCMAVHGEWSASTEFTVTDPGFYNLIWELEPNIDDTKHYMEVKIVDRNGKEKMHRTRIYRPASSQKGFVIHFNPEPGTFMRPKITMQLPAPDPANRRQILFRQVRLHMIIPDPIAVPQIFGEKDVRVVNLNDASYQRYAHGALRDQPSGPNGRIQFTVYNWTPFDFEWDSYYAASGTVSPLPPLKSQRSGRFYAGNATSKGPFGFSKWKCSSHDGMAVDEAFVVEWGCSWYPENGQGFQVIVESQRRYIVYIRHYLDNYDDGKVHVFICLPIAN